MIDAANPLFDKFWATWPRKETKQRAVRWFKKQKPTEQQVEQMLWQIRKELKPNGRLKPKEKQFIPLPETWLNDGDWRDAPTTEQQEIGNRYEQQVNQEIIERKKEEIRKTESAYFREKTVKELQTILNESHTFHRHWLIREIIAEKLQTLK